MKRIMLLASVGLVALLVMAVQPTYSMLHVDLEVRKLEGGGAVEIGYSVGSSPHRYEMIISVMPVDELKDVPDILIVGAGGRPGWSSAVTGLYDHITAELKIRGIAASVEMVDIGDLGSEMDTNDVIIIAEAVDMDEEAAADLMAWVMDGGRLICVGPSSLPFCQKLVDKRWTGPDDFLRVKYQRLNGYRIDAVEASTYAQALSLRTSAPVWALEKRYLDDLGAITIGYLHHDEDGDLVTSAMVPLGEGRLILFGGPVSQPSVVAGDAAISWDIVQLIVSGALWSTAEPEFTAFPLSADARAGTFISSMDGDLVVLAYSPQSHVPLYGRTVVAAS
ncbi:MAG TPA: hypothetical protein PLF76_06945 [Methanomassiliicoccaceae archaeon]|nr:hypothetical protein [Methanomassiliicoccaceae archaeon]